MYGKLEGEQEIFLPLGGKHAVTRVFSRLITPSNLYGHVTTVDVVIETGRKHQIRRHLDMIGHPIIGDKRYWFSVGGTGREKAVGIELCESMKTPTESCRANSCSNSFVPDESVMFLWSLEVRFPHPLFRHESAINDITQRPSHETANTTSCSSPTTATVQNSMELISVCIEEPIIFKDFRDAQEETKYTMDRAKMK